MRGVGVECGDWADCGEPVWDTAKIERRTDRAPGRTRQSSRRTSLSAVPDGSSVGDSSGPEGGGRSDATAVSRACWSDVRARVRSARRLTDDRIRTRIELNLVKPNDPPGLI